MGADRLLALAVLASCAPAVGRGVAQSTETAGVADDDGAGGDDDGTGDVGDGGDGTGDDGGSPESWDCQLAHDLDQLHHREGERIAFTVSCGRDDAPLSLVGGPGGAVFDAGTGAFDWQTDGADGGVHELVFGAERGGGELPESLVLTVWVADDPDAPGAERPDPLTYTEEWGLPVVHIEVGRDLTESELPATITVRGEQVEGAAKIRGASSTSYPKKSFTLDFESAELGVAEWGERTRDHMVLITAFDDNSYVRQRLGYELWAAMAAHQDEARLTPRTFFGVVYIDGVYQGLYTGCDRIDDEFMRHMGLDGEGQLYKSVSHDANFALTAASGAPKSWLGAGYEKTDGDDADWSDLEALVQFTGTMDAETLFAEGDQWIDVDEFVDWLLWARFTLAEDSAGKNAYLFHPPDSTVFRFTPWDLNHSFGQNWYTARRPADTDNDYFWNNRVFELLQTSEEGQARLAERAARLREPGGPFDPDVLIAQIDAWEALLAPSIERDWERWGWEYENFERWERERDRAGDWTEPDEELDYLRQWVRDRAEHLEDNGW